MFFEAKVNSLSNESILNWKNENGQITSGIDFIDKTWISNVEKQIEDGYLRTKDSIYWGCDSSACPVMHLLVPPEFTKLCHGASSQQAFKTSLGECRCPSVIGEENRAHLPTIRQRVENIAASSVESLVKSRHHIIITFICSGRLLGEFASLIRIFKVIRENSQNPFHVSANFIDPQYTEYIRLMSLKRKIEEESYRNPENAQQMENSLRVRMENLSQENFLHFTAINNSLNLLKYTLTILRKQPIQLRTRFFSTEREYESICIEQQERHDLLVGQDIEVLWDPVRALHQSIGKADSIAVAWSKKMTVPTLNQVSGKFETVPHALEIKQMKKEDPVWTTVEEIPLILPQAYTQASSSSSQNHFLTPYSRG